MKNSKNIIIGLVTVIVLVASILVMQIIETEKYIKENKILIEENKILIEEKITEYGNGYRDGMLESIDTYNYIELLIKYGVAKERIKWLEKQPYYIDNIMNDLDDLMEWTIRYYEVEPQTLRDIMELTEYILWKDNELYQRILNEWQE